MAKIVGGFLCPHAPLIFTHKGRGDLKQEEKIFNAFEHITKRIKELEATTVIIIGSDHYILFGTQCLPQMLICTGSVSGPIEKFEACPQYDIEVNTDLAKFIYTYGQDNNVDWAVSKSLVVDHAIALPHHYVVRPIDGLLSIPVYLNAGVAPGISKARAYRLGKQIREAVEAYPGGERVVLLGTGGLSHWVGSAQMGRVNPVFDQMVIDAYTSGNMQALIDLPDAEILKNGGEGAMEIRNHICTMGAFEGGNAELIIYEDVKTWITGMGFLEVFAKEDIAVPV